MNEIYMENSQELKNGLHKLLQLLIKLDHEHEATIKATKGNFNIFSILRKEHEEVGLHSSFIHNLLDPQGSHGFESDFLDLFLESIDDFLPENYKTQFGNPKWVGREVSLEAAGRADIYIEFENYTIIIENKIYHHEEDNQIERYSNYIKKNKSSNGVVIYLTLTGEESQTHNGHDYIRLSYKEQICHWLEKCLQHSYKFPNLNQVIIQYQNIVKKLTNQSFETEKMDKLTDFLKHYPILYKYRSEISQAFEMLYASSIDTFFEDLKDNLRTHSLNVSDREEMDTRGKGYDRFTALQIKLDPKLPFSNNTIQLWVERSEPWKALYIGLVHGFDVNNPITKSDQDLLDEIYSYFDKLSKTNSYHLTDRNQVTWSDVTWVVARHDVLLPFYQSPNDYYIQMQNKEFYDSQLEKATKEILQYIEHLKKAIELAVSES